ncbi:MAG: glycosyltransferase [bacterium]|nr:glycosyltransferase [bacterium]
MNIKIVTLLFALPFFYSSSLFSTYDGVHNPRVSIITSMYKGDMFIQGFLADIVQQIIFDECELILVNANSPDHEEDIIKEYCKKYPNIRYIKLTHDPGIYSVWNFAIKSARAAYITNANIDDRLSPHCYELHAHALDTNPEIDLVYSDYYWSNKPNETFEEIDKAQATRSVLPEFSKKAMCYCLPNNHPMWRKSMHDKYGFFDESYKRVGDYEMWLRAVSQGALFKKVSEILGVYYFNPKGLSTDSNSLAQLQQEGLRTSRLYGYVYRD